MGIIKVNLDEVFPPKPPKTKSEAVYVDNEPEPEKVTESKPRNWKAKLIQERLSGLNVDDIVYFPELAVEETLKYNLTYKWASPKEKAKINACIVNNAKTLRMKVVIYWVRGRKDTVIPRVTITLKKSEGS